jgi:hypothetical protein
MHPSILTEERLRALMYCPQLFELGGEVRLPLSTLLLQEVTERLTFSRLGGTEFSPTRLHTAVLSTLRAHGTDKYMLEQKEETLIRQGLLWSRGVQDLFPLKKYTPVYAAITPKARIGRVTVQLRISSVYRALSSQTIHFISFAPYPALLHLSMDWPSYMKLSLVRAIVAPLGKRLPAVVGHIFSTPESNPASASDSDPNPVHFVLRSDTLSEASTRATKQLIKQIQEGVHMPLVPCRGRGSCPLSEDCRRQWARLSG